MKKFFSLFLLLIASLLFNHNQLRASNDYVEDLIKPIKICFINTNNVELSETKKTITIHENEFNYLVNDEKKLLYSLSSLVAIGLAVKLPVLSSSWNGTKETKDCITGYIWNLIDKKGRIFKLFTANVYQEVNFGNFLQTAKLPSINEEEEIDDSLSVSDDILPIQKTPNFSKQFNHYNFGCFYSPQPLKKSHHKSYSWIK